MSLLLLLTGWPMMEEGAGPGPEPEPEPEPQVVQGIAVLPPALIRKRQRQRQTAAEIERYQRLLREDEEFVIVLNLFDD